MVARTLSLFVLLGLISACTNNDIAGPTDTATPANGLVLTLAVPGRCVVGGCDPVSGAVDHLGLITLTNTGTAKVFLPLCGTLPAFGTQQFVDGKWVNVGPAVACAFGPRSTVIAPHDSLQFNSFFAIGIWRMVVGAATDTALVNEGLATSAPVVVK